jgi:phospholipid-binding lipoprotein MlaA
MRSNGLPLALAALLAPASVLAQAAPETNAASIDPTVVATAPAQDVAAVATPATPAQAEAGAPTPAPATEPPVAEAATTPATDAPAAEATAANDGAAAEAQSDTTAGETTPADPQQEPQPAQTDAEQAFADIYGTQEFGDPNLPAAAVMPGTFDPWERYNRRMHRFNNAVDRGIARPLARGYVKVVPRPLRLGVSNFFNNLSQPLTMVNSLLQGKPKQAGQSLGRFLLNSTVGIGGIFDPATRAKLPQKSEDFGQTLGVWGWKRSRYFELPFFGPRTVRDVFGMAGDAPLSPLRQVEADKVRIPLQGLQLVDVRAQLLSTDSLREGAEDDYTLVRDAWSQRRDYQIFGDRAKGDGSDLPDYLREEEDDSTVPVDAIPVVVPGGG